jgi:5-carboxymethyl-2-hydroxymuconic-semialdehyde dehydrogenase/aminomuconate-semialdehyde/2-hydroxymuconate-6-semialdehyde dehydrogenase
MATTLSLIDPDGAEEVGRLQENTADEVARAVESAARAFRVGTWSGGRISERAATLRRAAELIRRDGDEIAALDSLTTGLLWHGSTRRHAAAAADWFDYFAGLIECEPETRFETGSGIQTRVVREPVGVAALFTPWNIPLMAAGLKLSAALAMGNSVVVKPSELSPLGTGRLVELLHEAGLPVGVVQLVNGRGITTGAALAAHPDVGCISFTGGPQAGAAIAAAASARFAKVTMELGGKSANIVLADAPYEAALEGTLSAAFGNSGQACLAGSRILVEAPIAERLIADLVGRTEALRIGNTFDPDAEIGPQSSRGQMERVLSYCEIARSEGAEILCGGKKAAGCRGFHVEPTIALVKGNHLRVCQEEIFGPLVTLQVLPTRARQWPSRTTRSSVSRLMYGVRTRIVRSRWLRGFAPERCSSTRRWYGTWRSVRRLRRKRRRPRGRPLEPRFL